MDLDTLTWLTPNLVLPFSSETWSNIAFGPTSSPQYGYVGNVGYFEDPNLPQGRVFKFGPLLRTDPPVPPCDAAGMTINGRTSRTDVRVVRPANGRALKSGYGIGHGPTVRYTVALANRSNKNHTVKANKTAMRTPFAPAGLVVTLPADATYVKSRVRPRLSKHNKTVSTGVYDAASHIVTWPDMPLAVGKTRKYTVWTKLQPTAASPLTYQALCPNCPQLVTQSNVTVRVRAVVRTGIHAIFTDWYTKSHPT